MKSNNEAIVKYYIFCALFQTIWCLGVLGFTIFLLLYLNTPWALLSLILVALKPYVRLNIERIDDSTSE